MKYTKELFDFFKLLIPVMFAILIILFFAGTFYNFISCGINDVLDLSTCSTMKEIFYDRQEKGFNEMLLFTKGLSIICLGYLILTMLFDLSIFLSKFLNLKPINLHLWKINWKFTPITLKVSENFKNIVYNFIIITFFLGILLGIIIGIYKTTFINLCL